LVTRKSEAVTPPAIVEKLLRAAGEGVVLVGGQALGFWVRRYDLRLPPGIAAISNDTDFLAGSAAERGLVDLFARAIGGKTWYPNEHALTSLVGQAYFDISDDEFVNVDVISDVVGPSREKVRERAVRATLGRHAFLVMHPLDVLHSRLANLHQLAEKQNPKGVMQLSMAIDVAREFLRQQAAVTPSVDVARRSPIQAYVSAIERMATEDAGHKVARRFGLHVADAIDPALIPAGPFWTRRWPGLRALMSPLYAARFQPPR
jgi:hypothetical protein